MSHPFQDLSPDRLMSALESKDIWPTGEPFALNSYENRVFMLRDEQGQRWVAKFYRPDRWSDALIQEEHDFLQELAAEDIPVAAPWRDDAAQSLHRYQEFRFALFPFIPGQAPELDQPDHLYALGQLLGRLHAVSARGHFQHRPTLALEAGVREAGERVLASGRMSEQQARAYRSVVHRIADTLARHKPTLIRCHGDCHLGNVLGRDDAFTLVDFDDCLMAPAIQDVWMLLPTSDQQSWQAQLSEVSEGYEESRAFPFEELALIEPLRAYRLVRHSAWLISRWDDPAFPQAFPWVADQHYWDAHIRQLESQVLQLEEPRWLAGP